MQAPIACCQDNRIKFVHYFGDAFCIYLTDWQTAVAILIF